MRAVVANVNVESIHDVVVRIGKQLLHRSIFNGGIDPLRHESTEIGSWSERGNIVQSQYRRGL